jgi:hypothetical protein
MRFLGFSNHKRELGGQNRLFHNPPEALRQTVCITFWRSEWSVLRSASFAKGGTSKKRPLPHLHKVQTLSHKVSSWTLQTLLVTYLSFINVFSIESRPVLEPTQHPMQWVSGKISTGLKRPRCEAEHSPPSSAEVSNAWRYTSNSSTSSWHGT